MESGAAIGTIAAPHGRSVVLVVSPADCLSCDVDLSQWLSSGRDTTVKVSIVLTRAADEAESRAIMLHRLPVAGRLGSRILRRPIAAPCVLQFDGGRPISSTCDPS